MSLQMDAVDSLGTQMALLKTKMTLYKEQHGTEKFNSYRDPVVTARFVICDNDCEEFTLVVWVFTESDGVVVLVCLLRYYDACWLCDVYICLCYFVCDSVCVCICSGTYSRKLDEDAAGGFSTSANLSSVLQPSSELLADAISTLHAPAEEKTSNGRVPLHER